MLFSLSETCYLKKGILGDNSPAKTRQAIAQ